MCAFRVNNDGMEESVKTLSDQFVLLCTSALAIAPVFVIACFLQPASAQLNGNCTVAILNRTTKVQPDGSWHLDNIPAGFGLVRARATCVQNGATQFGQ